MPCDTVVTTSLKWAASTDAGLLVEGLKQLGFTVEHDDRYRVGHSRESRKGDPYVRFRLGGTVGFYHEGNFQMTIRNGADGLESEIKQAYSQAVVNSQVQKFGGKVTWAKNAAGRKEAKVVWRTY